ncbi:MAG: transposase [Ignavibacteria bacterium]|nr:MAG: transposase [Ignavibacteria bacterium]QOJ27246.1 MAG: transposase [Ignavibacteria bacterium]
MLAQINEIYQATERSYGAEWIAHDIRKGGRRVGKTRVRRLMKQNGMPVQCKNTWKCMATTNSSETYHPHRISCSARSTGLNWTNCG